MRARRNALRKASDPALQLVEAAYEPVDRLSECRKLGAAHHQARFLRHQLAWAETELDLAARRVWDSLDEAEDEMESILREFVDRMRAAASDG